MRGSWKGPLPDSRTSDINFANVVKSSACGIKVGRAERAKRQNERRTTCSRVVKLKMEPRGIRKTQRELPTNVPGWKSWRWSQGCNENPKGTNQSFVHLQFGGCYCPKTSQDHGKGASLLIISIIIGLTDVSNTYYLLSIHEKLVLN